MDVSSIKLKPEIISASRRTDIPAFYSEKFISRLNSGYCAVINPYTKEKEYISFEKLKHVVFWSKNPLPMIKLLNQINNKQITYYFHFTLNNFPAAIEPNVPPLINRIETFKHLSEYIGPDKVIWRFDPIFYYNTNQITIVKENILNSFAYLSNELQSYANQCIFSFFDVYDKLNPNIYICPPINDQNDIAAAMYRINNNLKNPFKLSTCSESIDLKAYNISHSACIDKDLITRINPNITKFRTTHMRSNCNCSHSIDIGNYNTCFFGCGYCYASNHHTSIKRFSDDPEIF